MKKSFILLLALLVLVTGGTCYAQNMLLAERDQVIITENIIYGDKSVVEGVTVNLENQFDYNLFWNTVYEVGETPKTHTDYSFHEWDYYGGAEEVEGSVEFMQDVFDVYTFGYDTYDIFTGMNLAMKELYDETEPGTEKMKMVYLKDYIDYYTFGLNIWFPNEAGESAVDSPYGYEWEEDLRRQIAYMEEEKYPSEEIEEKKAVLADMKALHEFFKIPVLSTDACTIAISLGEKKEVLGVAASHATGGFSTGDMDSPPEPDVDGLDTYYFYTYSVMKDGDCYLTFEPHTMNGNLVDVSHIPGGFGIYHLTYDETKGRLNVDTLEMVYSLDVNVQIQDMMLDECGKNFLLFTSEKGNYYMSIIDRETMTLVEKINLGDDEKWHAYWSYENYFVAYGEELSVYTMDENGRYHLEFSVKDEKIQDLMNWDCVFDWNGSTLLIGNNLRDSAFRKKCGFYIAAIDKSGLLYYGEYQSSLECQQDCVPNPNVTVPIRAFWN